MTAPARVAARSRLKLGAILAAILGSALALAVVGYVGFAAVLSAVALIGLRGLAFLCLYAVLPFALLGAAWWVIVPPSPARRWWKFILARVARDAAGELLPFSQLGGFVVGARAAVLQGISATTASATTIVDVTTELIAQLGFTGLGVAMLALILGLRSSHGDLLAAGVIGLALSAAGAAGFILVQRNASGLILRLTKRFAPALAARAGDVGRELDGLYERPLKLAIAVGIHLAAWVASATGVWLALRFAGVKIGLASILAIESLVYAVRSAAFVAPMGVGVQEAAYGLVGPLFGLPADLALAISLIKRARDLALGLPALLVWQALEGRRLAGAGRPAALESD
ncbi:MAG TPA: lysylphosphatidylglycerol synthase domain-containing protein [Caulobacteraceae bacterium]